MAHASRVQKVIPVVVFSRPLCPDQDFRERKKKKLSHFTELCLCHHHHVEEMNSRVDKNDIPFGINFPCACAVVPPSLQNWTFRYDLTLFHDKTILT
jgi:hypothetical protein